MAGRFKKFDRFKEPDLDYDDDAYEQGMNACGEGICFSDNPYHENLERLEFLSWSAGWCDQDIQDRIGKFL